MDWIKILLSFVIGAIATSFTLGAAISKYETTEHAEKTYVRKDVYIEQRQDIKDQLNRIEKMIGELSSNKEDKKGK